jgi:hypothetical protein
VKPRKGIYRVVHRTGTKGWSAVIRRASGEVARLFSDNVYGGSRKAYRVASTWYEQTLPHYPLATRIGKMTTIRRNNQSGVSGVYRWPANGGNRPGACWAAQWVVESRQVPVRRKYSIAFYGEQQAKDLAVKARNAAIKKLQQENSAG